ncbi:tyrosine-protein phosphatase [Cohnella terricola]|uniref:Tyrosine-protein phosphatase n=1 Tax=Cohnella terricola TaxID=1289167 RepID=A0A559JN10_9BACL|nr:CpsB/CapC family capsule biosynthesis tyrosine phosphatase [Cohnella terricola]TVY01262.1 protein tyrosine phosphatase [Cohnella terricola]
MIDIHTHILPGVDDGAVSWELTIEMARAAAAEGITVLIATPHHANGRYLNPAAEVEAVVLQANERLTAAGLNITIRPGQEIRVHDGLLDAWDQKELLTLAGSDYMLIELPSSRIPKGMGELIHELNMLKLKPIIAHPERNAEIAEHPERLSELLEEGAYAQVTTHSLLGGFGRGVERTAWSLCAQGLIHLVSSDAHHPQRRGFRLREAYGTIRDRLGEEWETWYMDNARCVIENHSFGERPAIATSPPGGVRRLLSYFRKKTF